MQQVILIRGLPGSGKSTLAKSLIKLFPDDAVSHREADTYFELNANEEYEYEGHRIMAAHRWCLFNSKKDLEAGKSLIVSNTFLALKELKPYVELAKSFGITPQILLCQNNYGSVHDVPQEKMKKLKSRLTLHLDELFESPGKASD